MCLALLGPCVCSPFVLSLAVIRLVVDPAKMSKVFRGFYEMWLFMEQRESGIRSPDVPRDWDQVYSDLKTSFNALPNDDVRMGMIARYRDFLELHPMFREAAAAFKIHGNHIAHVVDLGINMPLLRARRYFSLFVLTRARNWRPARPSKRRA